MKHVVEIADFAIRIFLTALLVYSGLIHLQNPYLFLDSVLQYGIANSRVATAVAATVPLFHIYVGMGLLLFPKNSLFEAVAVFAMFLFYFLLISYAWSFGMKIGCGCFGGLSEQITGATVVRSAILVLLSGLVAIRGYRQLK